MMSMIQPVRPKDPKIETQRESEEISRTGEVAWEDQLTCGMCNPVAEKYDGLSQEMVAGEKMEEEKAEEGWKELQEEGSFHRQNFC